MTRVLDETTTATLDADAALFAELLGRSGLYSALAFLNARTRHRYTGVYRFDPPLLRSVCLVDRENPGIALGGDTPMRETYCSIVGRRRAPFAAADAAADRRLVRHPARTSVLAYCGVPLRRADGTAAGTLCHYDLRPRLVPAPEVPLMERAAALIAAAHPGLCRA